MKNNALKIYLLAFFLVSNFAVFAQDTVGDEDPDGCLECVDDPPGPINAKLIYLALIGIAFAFYYFSKKRRTA